MVIIPQIDLQIQYNAYWNPTNLFSRYWQADYKINIETSRTQNSQNILGGEKNKIGGLSFPTFKTYYKQ